MGPMGIQKISANRGEEFADEVVEYGELDEGVQADQVRMTNALLPWLVAQEKTG
jgi:hypothetical protein